MGIVRGAAVGALCLVALTGCSAESASGPVIPATSLTASPVPAGAVVPDRIADVPSAVPTRISIPALGMVAPVGVMDASACPVLDPPTLDDAYWVGCRGRPGTDSDGTVFIIGHSLSGGEAVFNELPKLAPGDDVEVTTTRGTLVYRVQRTATYAKFGEVQTSPEVIERVPGRLVLVTCMRTPEGGETDDNFVAQAELVGAIAA